ncbi:MAG: hypothetical protein P8Y71_20240 [Pseudolabrys sp.]|jgi:hypothetical protein
MAKLNVYSAFDHLIDQVNVNRRRSGKRIGYNKAVGAKPDVVVFNKPGLAGGGLFHFSNT